MLAIVSGASSGIGEAAARQLAAAGYKVVLIARNKAKLEEIASKIGEQAVVESCDASDGEAVQAIASRVRHDYGVPDLIVNCAGAGQWKWIEETSPAEAKVMMNAPYFAAFNLSQVFMEEMLNRGSGILIHVNSPGAFIRFNSMVSYAAARWALRGLHEMLSADLRGTGVRSCHLVLGKVLSGYFEHNPGVEENIPSIANTIRTLTPEECGRLIVNLAKRPRSQVFHPFMLKLYILTHKVWPSLVHYLIRITGPKRK